jgi:hypothetical protein
MAPSKSKDIPKSIVMPDIPEERFSPEGRPISLTYIPQNAAKADKDVTGTTTTVTELPVCLTEVRNEKDAAADEFSDIAIPQNIQGPVVFGPRSEYKAVPSILECYSSKGRSKVSIREATSEEAIAAAGRPVTIVTDIPQLAAVGNKTSASEVPDPILNTAPQESQNFPWHSSGHATTTIRTPPRTELIRSSTTEIRMSTTTEADDIFENDSNTSTLFGSGSPPQRLQNTMSQKASTKVPLVSAHVANTTHLPVQHHLSPETSRDMSTMWQTGSHNATPSSRFSWQRTDDKHYRNWFSRWFVDWWAMELLSLLFSAICMTIIITVLYKVDGKEMPKWY